MKITPAEVVSYTIILTKVELIRIKQALEYTLDNNYDPYDQHQRRQMLEEIVNVLLRN